MNKPLNPGDVVYVRKSLIIRHYGIYIGDNIVIEASPSSGCVRKVTLDAFYDGKQLSFFTPKSKFDPEQIVMRAEIRLGRSYGLISANCEHFKNEVVFGKATSDQVTLGLTVASIFLALKLFGK